MTLSRGSIRRTIRCAVGAWTGRIKLDHYPNSGPASARGLAVRPQRPLVERALRHGPPPAPEPKAPLTRAVETSWVSEARPTEARTARQHAAAHARRAFESEGRRSLVAAPARSGGARRASKYGAAVRCASLRLCERGVASAFARAGAPARSFSRLLAIVCGNRGPPRHRREAGPARRSLFQRLGVVARRELA